MKKLLIGLSVVGGIALSQGCGFFGDGCKVDEATCDGDQLVSCEATDDGVTHSSTYECPAEQRCFDPGGKKADCVTNDVGGTCKTDLGCHRDLRCVAGFCAAPPDAVISACKNAPLVHVPDDGSSVRAAVTIDQSDPLFAQLLVRPLLAMTGATPPDVTRFGIIRVDESATYMLVRLDPADPQVFQVVGTTCEQLYDADISAETEPGGPQPIVVVVLNEGSTATTGSINLSRQ